MSNSDTSQADSTHQAISQALSVARDAKSLDELRRSLAVTLTLKHRLTLSEVAELIGMSPAWASTARRDYLKNGKVRGSLSHGGRRNQIMPLEDEAEFMDDVCRDYVRLGRTAFWKFGYKHEDMQIHRFVARALQKRTGRPIPYSTAFALMARVGKTKFAPYTAKSWDQYCRDEVLV